MNNSWTTLEQVINKSWTNDEQVMNNWWTSHEQVETIKSRASHKQAMCMSWSNKRKCAISSGREPLQAKKLLSNNKTIFTFLDIVILQIWIQPKPEKELFAHLLLTLLKIVHYQYCCLRLPFTKTYI